MRESTQLAWNLGFLSSLVMSDWIVWSTSARSINCAKPSAIALFTSCDGWHRRGVDGNKMKMSTGYTIENACANNARDSHYKRL